MGSDAGVGVTLVTVPTFPLSGRLMGSHLFNSLFLCVGSTSESLVLLRWKIPHSFRYIFFSSLLSDFLYSFMLPNFTYLSQKIGS